MEDILKSKLKEDETLLWCARPEAFETLDKTHKARFVHHCAVIRRKGRPYLPLRGGHTLLANLCG